VVGRAGRAACDSSSDRTRRGEGQGAPTYRAQAPPRSRTALVGHSGLRRTRTTTPAGSRSQQARRLRALREKIKKVASRSRSTYTRRRRACWTCVARPLRACLRLPTYPTRAARLPLWFSFPSVPNQRRPFHASGTGLVSDSRWLHVALLAHRGQGGCPASFLLLDGRRAQLISCVTSPPTTRWVGMVGAVGPGADLAH
jgi:hypothetical protein